MISFYNPSTLDPRLITTFGASVKTSESSIGYFGTGLKYAIAGILRLGGTISIETNEGKINIEQKEEEIRGKVFPVVYFNSNGHLSPVGFTAELGKNWTPWMLFRELWSNMRDEGGAMWVPAHRPENYTIIQVECAELDKIRDNLHLYVLQTHPLYSSDELEIHQGSSQYIFFHGMQASQLRSPSRFTYNLKTSKGYLTEDRQLPDYLVLSLLSRHIPKVESDQLLRTIAQVPQTCFEHGLDAPIFMGQAFRGLTTLLTSHRGKIIPNWELKLMELSGGKAKPRALELSPAWQKSLDRAYTFCNAFGERPKCDVIVTDGLGEGILGMATREEIYLSSRVFQMGVRQVSVTLLEELIHFNHNLRDFTREFQDHLFNLIANLSGEDF